MDKKNRREKLQYDINSETAKISALSLSKIDMNILQGKKYYLLVNVK